MYDNTIRNSVGTGGGFFSFFCFYNVYYYHIKSSLFSKVFRHLRWDLVIPPQKGFRGPHSHTSPFGSSLLTLVLLIVTFSSDSLFFIQLM